MQRLYYHARQDFIISKLQGAGISDQRLQTLTFENREACLNAKNQIESLLKEHGFLCLTQSEAVANILKGASYSFVSLHVKIKEMIFDRLTWYAVGLQTFFKYGYEKVPATIWLQKMQYEYVCHNQIVKKEEFLENCDIAEVDLLGIVKLDYEKREIDIIPLVLYS